MFKTPVVERALEGILNNFISFAHAKLSLQFNSMRSGFKSTRKTSGGGKSREALEKPQW